MLENLLNISQEINLLQKGTHPNPHQFLGLHPLARGDKIIRLWAPGKNTLHFRYKNKLVRATRINDKGLFSYLVPKSTTHLHYQIQNVNGEITYDPYAFPATLSHTDAHLFQNGVHYTIYHALGAHPTCHHNVLGIKFGLWAPNAQGVSLICDLNHWICTYHPMRQIEISGFWEIFLPNIKEGLLYKYAICTKNGDWFFKSDPFGNQFEKRPKTASKVASTNAHAWQDQAWLHKRRHQSPLENPINIYEVHLGSWIKQGCAFINYRDLAHKLAPYVHNLHYTHIELMPIMEHPLDESWGYQTTGYYAPTSRFGSVEDFQYFIDYFHRNEIGVLLDWSPAHFPDDAFGLSYFDGQHVYEKSHEIMGRHPEWNTKNFHYARKEVSNFLLGSALFWLEEMHADGLRVDGVQSMLYLDYGRLDGGWEPNRYGGKENLDAIEFLKHLNSIIHQKFPGILMIAEDSSLFEGVTRPVEWNGLGFDMKWNIGWMNDFLRFMQKDPVYRKYHMDDLTRSFGYAFTERFLLPLSHDEVVHGKRHFMQKMPLHEWDQFAQLRLLYSTALCHPGKNLFFMGIELAEWKEWDCKRGIDWSLIQEPNRKKWHFFVQIANHFYKSQPALWLCDFHPRGFTWINHDNDHSIISYLRKGHDERDLLCVHNYTPIFLENYEISLHSIKSMREIFNSDNEEFGGTGQTNDFIHIIENSRCQIKIPSFSTMVFQIVYA